MEETSRKILDRICAVTANERFPLMAELLREHDEEQWLVQDLVKDGFAADVHQRLVPTRAGLRATAGSAAAELLAALNRLIIQIQAGPPITRTVRVADVVDIVGSQTGMAFRVMACLLASAPPGALGAALDARQQIAEITTTPEFYRWRPDERIAAPPVDSPPPSLTVSHFRGLRDLKWSPGRGVSLLVGPNGAGKSTVLGALAFLRDAFEEGIGRALVGQHGAEALRNAQAPEGAAPTLALSVGDVRWEVALDATRTAVSEFPGEVVAVGKRKVVRRATASVEWWLNGRQQAFNETDGRTCFRTAWERARPPELERLVELIRSARIYGAYDLAALREGGRSDADNTRLDRSGANLLHVLRNWKSAEVQYERRYDWVIARIQAALPGQAERLEFGEQVANLVPAHFYPASGSALPVHRGADGLLIALLHLAAVAGAPRNSVVAIDEVENHLHPHAIRALLTAMRDRAAEQNLTVLLTSHSPVVMNEFRDAPERFFVLEPSDSPQPVPLDQLHDRDWLSLYSLGLLYEEERFGAPEPPTAPVR